MREKLSPILTINYEPATLTAKRLMLDAFAVARAWDLRRDKRRRALWRDFRRNPHHFASGLTTAWPDVPFVMTADGTAVASTASETTLFNTTNPQQPIVPTAWFMRPMASMRLYAAGIFSNTGTPTMTWQLRMGGTGGVTTYSGTSIGVSAAITTASGVSNVYWDMEYQMESRTSVTPGSSNTTLSGGGKISSGAGFASPFIYSLIQAAGSATWTWTGTQADVQNYINFSLTWSASSSSNTCTMKRFKQQFDN